MEISARRLSSCVLACAVLGQACAQTQQEPAGVGPSASAAESSEAALLLAASPSSAAGRYRPAPQTTWQIQFTGAIDTNVSAELFDLDLFDTSAELIEALHARGRRVICYFDGAYESWRPDSDKLERYRGNPMEGWPGQYWLDIRAPEVINVMQKRIVLARDKGCDGVEADDVDSVDNDPGFPITREEQQRFVIRMANWAHALGLAFGLKNALEDVPLLQHYADFAINEECFRYDECERLEPFIAGGKPVLHIEYADGAFEPVAESICPRSKALAFSTLIKHLDLDAARYPCP